MFTSKILMFFSFTETLLLHKTDIKCNLNEYCHINLLINVCMAQEGCLFRNGTFRHLCSEKQPTSVCCLTELQFTFCIMWTESNFNLIYKCKTSTSTSNMDSMTLFIYLFLSAKLASCEHLWWKYCVWRATLLGCGRRWKWFEINKKAIT